jgi:hypothetical protein
MTWLWFFIACACFTLWWLLTLRYPPGNVFRTTFLITSILAFIISSYIWLAWVALFIISFIAILTLVAFGFIVIYLLITSLTIKIFGY